MATCLGSGIPMSAEDLVRQCGPEDVEAIEAALAELKLRESVVEVMSGLKIASQEGAKGVLVMFAEEGLEMTLVTDEDTYEDDQPSLFDKLRATFGRRGK